ncbi:hypothetical protein EK904_005159 [Melospiza melodia maxima]|nr:hypothetical protein EK904_005159 [Melospiza melodia maxima]
MGTQERNPVISQEGNPPLPLCPTTGALVRAAALSALCPCHPQSRVTSSIVQIADRILKKTLSPPPACKLVAA